MKVSRRLLGRSCWTGWGISGFLHAALLLVIGLLLMPMATRGVPIEVAVSLVDQGADLLLLRPLAATRDPAPAESFWSPRLADPGEAELRVENPLDFLASGGAGEGSTTSGMNGGSSRGSGGASFFGTVANGDRFVYILDVSPSMNQRRGKRLERAVLELLRSIDRLAVDQSFYVIVFGWQTRRMFDDRAADPATIPATFANKRKLRRWLAGLRTIKGTDPRQSLVLGLEIQPSAIFLLSDGEFNKPRNASFFEGDDRAVIDVVHEARRGVTPVHTITFEDRVGQRAMARIAAESGGSNRFIPAPAGADGPTGRLSYKLGSNLRRLVLRFAFHEEERHVPTSPKVAAGAEAKAWNWIELAELMEQAGKPQRAKQYYARIVDDYPFTQAAQVAERRVGAAH